MSAFLILQSVAVKVADELIFIELAPSTVPLTDIPSKLPCIVPPY